jgi:hypothetical protein
MVIDSRNRNTTAQVFLINATSFFRSSVICTIPLVYLLPLHTKRSLAMKMYVGNLIYNMTEKELKNLFSPFGQVLSSHIIKDQYTRQSKNMGYVVMAVREEGKKAMQKLHGKEINNRSLIVKKA